MASWVKWQADNRYIPCPGCQSDESVYWPAGMATRNGLFDEHGRDLDTRRNNECPHEMQMLSQFVKTTEDDPRAEWKDIDWEPPATV